MTNPGLYAADGCGAAKRRAVLATHLVRPHFLAKGVLRILMGDNGGPFGSMPAGRLTSARKARNWVGGRLLCGFAIYLSLQPTLLGSG